MVGVCEQGGEQLGIPVADVGDVRQERHGLDDSPSAPLAAGDLRHTRRARARHWHAGAVAKQNVITYHISHTAHE